MTISRLPLSTPKGFPELPMGFSGPKAALGMPLRDFAECDQRPSYRAAHGVRRLIQGMPEVQKETPGHPMDSLGTSCGLRSASTGQ